MASRYFAAIGEMTDPPRVRHFVGLPPKLTEGQERRVQLTLPSVVVLVTEPDGSVMFYRYLTDAREVGDTWHETMQYAKEQAEFEYGAALGEWTEIPEDVDNAVSFALAHVQLE